MTKDRFHELVDQRLGACHEVMWPKMDDYAKDSDQVFNFKLAAELLTAMTGRKELPVTPGLVWFVYFYKHLVPIVRALVLEEDLKSEDLGSRFTDAINYLLLGEGIAEDKREEFATMLAAVRDEVSTVTNAGLDKVAMDLKGGAVEDLGAVGPEPIGTPWYQKPLERLKNTTTASPTTAE